MAEQICASCVNSIYCDTWAEWKCKINEKRIYSTMELSKKCSDYKKRGKDFNEVKCQCEDCLRNESLLDEIESE